MSSHGKPDREIVRRDTSGLLEVLIRAGLILVLTLLCYQVFAPFLTLMVWAVILAVTLYPLHQLLADRMGGKQGTAAVILVVLGIALLVVPTAVLMSSLGDSVHELIIDVQQDTLAFPAPPDSVATWPVVGERVHKIWSAAYADLPTLVKSRQPKLLRSRR